MAAKLNAVPKADVFDTTRERTRTLPDGSVLTYRRPGGTALRTIADDALVDALSDRSDRLSEVPAEERTKLEKRMERRQIEKADRQERELAALPRDERKKKQRELRFNGLEHPRIIQKFALSWKYGDEAIDVSSLEVLKDLPDDVLEEAARVIFDAHYDREQDLRGNSATTSAS